MKIVLVVVAVLVALLLVAGIVFGWAVHERNALVIEQQAVKAQWAQVDVALQRRADLIPNLVETVKGYAKQEVTVFTNIANARAALGGAQTPQQKMQANGQLDSALSRLLVIVENYPQLKSDRNFQELQFELAGTENRIAIERRKYNEAVQEYNKDLQLFPRNVIAGMFGFQAETYFQTEAGARTAPKVAF
jgi:LemA protein